MNGRHAKQLRRQAEADTIGLSNVHYNGDRCPAAWVFFPNSGDPRQVQSGIPTRLTACTRHEYQMLKQAGAT